MSEGMNRREFLQVTAVAGAALAMGSTGLSFAQEMKPLPLPPPQKEGGKPLMEALQARQSAQAFSPEKLSPQGLSNLLWAAAGINRPDGKRTSATASNKQELDIYVAMAEGLFLYEPKAHALLPVLKEDIRSQAGSQAYLKDAAVVLIYVSDYARMTKGTEETMLINATTGAALAAQNVYLFGASAGLAVRVRSNIDRPLLAKAMKLRPDQKITLDQAVSTLKK
ncbi:MAG: nitroreductase family protein [Deltaproteobacteria bacterium]|nr:nitroreductase family protein [Deltaproteobacteria bacterium]